MLDLETLLNSTDIATLFLDHELRISNFTPRLSEIYRIKSVDLGREIADLAHLAVDMPPYHLSGDVQESEIHLSNGKVFLRRVVPYKNTDMKKSGLVVAFIDVSELRTKKAKLEAVFEGANAAMVIFEGRDLVYERVNPEYMKVVGKRDLIGKRLIDAIPEVKATPIPEILQRVFDTGVVHRGVEVKVPLRNPETGKIKDHYFDNIYRRINRPDGQPYGVFAHSVDVTANVISRLRAEQAEERLNVAIDSAEMGTWDYDPHTGLAILSPRASELFGLDHTDDPFDLSLAIFRIHPEDSEYVTKAIANALNPEGSGQYRVFYRVLQKDNTYKWLNVRGHVRFAGSGKEKKATHFAGVMYDVTEQKKVEAGFIEAVKARDEFLSIASHELKTPLTSLIIQTQVQKRLLSKGDERASNPERVLETYNKFERLFGRLNRLIDDMLDISRISFGKLEIRREKTDLSQLVEDVISRHGEGATIEFTPHPVSGNWDPLRLEQVIINLVTNAVRYGKGEPISISIQDHEKEISLSVKDRGIGISADDQKKIFERFERAVNANDISGLGLGLYISDQIVQLHGGSISLESAIGKGSTFTVKLPKDA